MRIEPEITGVEIVLLGDFNPAIFTPAWFALHNLLPRGVADSADLNVSHRQITSFATDWLSLQVQPEQFRASTSQAPCVRVRDLVLRIFKEHLFHTPLRALGVNREVHFRVANMAERDRMGRTLAPLEPWDDWGRGLLPDGTHGGLASLTMRQMNIDGRAAKDQINVTVQPSNRVGDGIDGVYARVNDHYAIDETVQRPGEYLMTLLEENFDGSIEHSDTLIDHIMSLAK